ncbi:hypothetical protein G7Y89_g15868 [Cudoniella acicularis]|uniref:NB-ARC domain-containing protein n=1 Tax=Cudoniella acicularis TaxID=354080 RepID=A0A8H4VHA4_9HELO|nr:hypothetical protein G7Y89_g15868 [Cudoniella acicularis]
MYEPSFGIPTDQHRHVRRTPQWYIIVSTAVSDFKMRVHSQMVVINALLLEFAMDSDVTILKTSVNFQHLFERTPGEAGLEVALPCHTIPWPRNPYFSGRSELMSRLINALGISTRKSTTPHVRVAALWGTGGIGKTQVALEFAHLELTGGIPVILWISCETIAQATSDFGRAAAELRLPQSLSDSAEDKIFSVQEWLKTTETPWLVVLDGVEDWHIVSKFWPAGKNSSILITCRSQTLLYQFNAVCLDLETLAFSPEEGQDLLLKLVGDQFVDENDLLASRKMSIILGGLPTVLVDIGRQIRFKRQKITKFLAFYRKHHQRIYESSKKWREPYNYPPIHTTWQFTFFQLSPDATKLLSVLCFFAPQGITIPLQDLSDSSIEEWNCLDLEQGLEELCETGLVKSHEGAIPIPKLAQEQFFNDMTQEQHETSFQIAVRILRPYFRHGVEEVREKAMIPHIHAFRRRQEVLREKYWFKLEN